MRLILLLFFALAAIKPLCAQVPANDDCANAIPVGTGETVTFDNTEATFDGPFHPACQSTDNDTIWRDIWYVFTPNFTGYADWSLCDQALFDTKIAVYNAGAACPLTDSDLLLCNDDYGACQNNTSRIIFTVEAGQSYMLRVGAWSATGPGTGGSGTFTIGELVTILANDFCEQAFAISIGENQPVTNEGATTDGPAHPNNNACFGFGDNTVQADIWYSFTPEFSGSVIWSVCDQVPFDSRMAVYNAGATCPLQDSDLMACNDDGNGCSDYTSKLFFEVVAGETYLMRLGGYDGESGIGVMDLLYETPPPPPANDLCAVADSAWIVTAVQADAFEGLVSGTTSNGTFEAANFIFPDADCIQNTASGEFTDVWYWFNTEGNTELEIRFNADVDNLLASFYVNVFVTCDSMVDPTVIPGACIFASPDAPLVSTVLTGLPDEPTLLLMRVGTHTTYHLPGPFFFFLVGEIPTPDPTSGVEDLAFLEKYELRPNPASDKAHLNLLISEAVDMELRLLNALGQPVLTKDAGRLAAGSHQLEFDVADLMPGVYFIELRSDKGHGTLRLLKQ